MTSLAKIRSLFAKRKCSKLSSYNVLRMLPDQAKRAEKFMNSTTYALFGDVDLEEMVATAFCSIQIEDDEGNFAGMVVGNTYPRIPALPPWEWDHWLQTFYGLEEIISRNTIWIHLAIWDPAYCYLFMYPIAQRMFQLRIYLRYVVMVVPPGVNKIDFLGDLGMRILPKDCTNPKACQTLYLMKREDFMPNYKLRRAVEEDNDDLVPLIGAHSKRLEELYGHFYIAELLTRHKDSGRQILVAEYNGVAVAVLCLNEVVNYKVLNEEFELGAFNGLKKYHPDDADHVLDVLYPSVELPPFSSEEEVIQIVERKSSDLSPDHRTAMPFSDQDILVHVATTSSEDFSLVFTSASIFIFQDDDDKPSTGDITIDDLDVLSEFGDILRKMPKLPELPDSDALSICTADLSKAKSRTTFATFLGEPNAFCIEIAAALPEHDKGLMLLFESAFDCFPDRDYSIMSTPSTLPVNRLCELFVRVTPQPTATFPLELYILHKNAVFGTIGVRAARHDDDDKIKRLLLTIPNNYFILQQYHSYLNDPHTIYLVYILTCESEIVGVATLSEDFDFDYIMAHYEVISCADPKLFKSGCHGLMESLVLSPIFHNHSNFFLREIHRLSDFTVLYYKHTPYDSTDMYRERPLVNLLHTLFPILPRTLPEYDLDVLRKEECEVSSVITEKKSPYALYICTNPKCSINRYTVNIKIVVVGTSNTALAFLESLILSQNPRLLISFNNITMVGSHGIRSYGIGDKLLDSFMVKKYFTDRRHMDLISLRTYVNYVRGKLTKIDRKEKYILVNDDNYVAYDLLFLMCGESFLKPKTDKKINVTNEPLNCFLINDAVDASNAVIRLKKLYLSNTDEDYLIIVYGHFLEAYCALHGLLAYGVPGSHIAFVEPFPYTMTIEKRQRHSVSIYNDPDVDDAVLAEIKAQGIAMHCSYYFVGWEFDKETNMITSAKFESSHKLLELECLAMFYFHNKGISPRIYKVINEAGLVYDGRLVIDKNCRTNDPNIYGAGTLTKYSRKYYASHMTHKYFNRREIGKRLGQQIKSMLLPKKIINLSRQKSGWNFDVDRGGNLVPKYNMPIMRYCRLPGGLHYMCVVKPGKVVPLETTICLENYGQFLITGNCKDLDKQGYFKLHLNQYKRVETITCLTKFPIDMQNIYRLWGKHERLLNNLQLRFEMGIITDLYDYFKEPWAYAIYHDRFGTLMDDLNSLMTSTFNNEASLVSEVIDMYKEVKWKELTQEQNDSMELAFYDKTYPKFLEQKVLEFIKKNLDHLPMYAHPVVIKILLAGYKKSPMFSK